LWFNIDFFEFQNNDQIVNIADKMLFVGENYTTIYNKKKN
jgi:hypothetical protein